MRLDEPSSGLSVMLAVDFGHWTLLVLMTSRAKQHITLALALRLPGTASVSESSPYTSWALTALPLECPRFHFLEDSCDKKHVNQDFMYSNPEIYLSRTGHIILVVIVITPPMFVLPFLVIISSVLPISQIYIRMHERGAP